MQGHREKSKKVLTPSRVPSSAKSRDLSIPPGLDPHTPVGLELSYGDHWHGIYREPGQPDLVYDSFGRGTRGFRGRGTERDAEQKKTGADRDSCGQRCLAFGLVAQSI